MLCRQLLKQIGPVLCIQCVTNLFQIIGYFEKSKFEFSRFYCSYIIHLGFEADIFQFFSCFRKSNMIFYVISLLAKN